MLIDNWSVPSDKNFVLVDTPKKFSTMVRVLEDKKIVSLDTEATGLNPRKVSIVGLSIGTSFLDAFYIPMVRVTKEPYWVNESITLWLKKWLSDNSVKKILHNGKFDRKLLREVNLDIGGFVFDTMLADYLCNENVRHKLELCGRRELPTEHSKCHDYLSDAVHKIGIVNGSAENMLRIPMELIKNYACMDTTTTWGLSQIYEKRLDDQNLARLFYMLIMPLQEVLMEMEEGGVQINEEKLNKLKTEEPEHLQFEEEIFKLLGRRINLNSPKQIEELLYDDLKLTLSRQGDKRPTDDDTLDKLSGEHVVIDYIRKYRSAYKIYSSYIIGLSDLLEDGRLYTDFLAHGTKTGRLASVNPNLQNIPVRSKKGREIRACFIPDFNCKFLGYDYSQIELRVLACLSQDPILLNAYIENKDIHIKTAGVIYKILENQVSSDQRDSGKTLNFGIIYGMSSYGLAVALKGHWVPGEPEKVQAQRFIDRYFEEYKGVFKFIRNTENIIDKTHEIVNMFGRKRRLPDIVMAKGGMRSFLLRQGVNALVQGTASDITSLSLIRVNNMLKKGGYKTRPKLDVHDELIFNMPDEEIKEVPDLINKEMVKSVGDMTVSLEVGCKISDCWQK